MRGRVPRWKEEAEREYVDIPDNANDDDVEDVDYEPEEEHAPEPTVDRFDWPGWAIYLHMQMTGLETFVCEELTDLRRLIVHGLTAEEIGVGPPYDRRRDELGADNQAHPLLQHTRTAMTEV
ncbi:hypothetical protein L6452_22061 [Arctium lappa]|uniref:Uncharacterized protein n=1 Tax=Arctium lappa TaxID=4217 RepID=A0ACB9AXY3_ARCLA|nr:hypothetical protein L6452_22061 [Arctium lappa]